MANTTDRLFETETQLESMVEASGKTIPKPGGRANIVEHLDYIIALMGTMVTDETYKEAKKRMAKGYNAIPDRVETINWLLSTGEISGDVDIEPITITENGEYLPGAGKAYSRVVVEMPEDQSAEIIERTASKIYNNQVKNIPYLAFGSRFSNLTSVSFPECITIGSYAFNNCLSLREANFPKCNSIGSYAFTSCSSLNSINFPLCESIGISAFAYCYSLSIISFPNCTNISTSAFFSCNNLEEIYFEKYSGTLIGNYGFSSPKLRSVSIPSCTNISSSVFSGCSYLSEANFPNCTNIGNSAFNNCHSLSKANFPNCNSIGNDAFIGCISLTEVNFPECRTIGQSAFAHCSSLVTASFPNCSFIAPFAFYHCTSLKSLYLTNSSMCSLYSYNTIPDPYNEELKIYVPSSLLDTYIQNDIWSRFSNILVGI